MATAVEIPPAKPRSKLERPPRPPAPRDPVTSYARAVIRGRVVASKFVHQAARRHLSDLRRPKRDGLRFDRRKAWRAIKFARTLKHIKGRWAGKPIRLEPWQEFIVGSIFGWVRADGTRRFQDVYIEVARKNGKSTLLAVIMILLTFFDGEGGAEGYIAATKKDQAKIIFNDCKVMVRKSPIYRRRLKALEHRISDPETASFMAPLGADADTLDGLNPHAVAIDELHAHPTAKVLEVMESGQGARTQPICIKITTAGWNRNSVCWRQREHAAHVLDPKNKVADDSLFAFIATLDDGDDFKDEKCWAKANPGIDVSVDRAKLRRDVHKALDTPEELPNLLQKRFDVWVSNSIDRPFDMADFDAKVCAAPFEVERLRGRACFLALDLARNCDISSLGAIFPPLDPGELWKYLGWHFIPEDDIRQRADRDGVPYATWRAQEKIITTPGNTTDLTLVGDKCLEVIKLYKVVEFAYDPTFAPDVARRVAATGTPTMEHWQKYPTMTLPCSEMLRLVRSRKLQHGGDPVLRWAMDNLVLRAGPSGRLLPDKERSREKIDPAVALIMAIGRAAVALPQERSALESSDPIWL